MSGAGDERARNDAALVESVVELGRRHADASRAVLAHAGEIERDLASVGSITLIVVGKAAAGMARGAMRLLGPRVREGVVIVPRGAGGDAGDAGTLPSSVSLMVADHPNPSAASLEAGRRVIELHQRANLAVQERANGTEGGPHAIVLMISGGASALMVAPRAGVMLEDISAVSRALMRAGAGIDELNTVRRRLDVIKGGGLLGRSPVFTYAISDVPGDDLRTIGSGPGVADSTTDAEALGVLGARGVLEASPRVVEALRRGVASVAADAAPAAPSVARVLLNNADCLREVAASLSAVGEVVEVRSEVRGEAREVAGAFVRRLMEGSVATSGGRRRLLLWGGETTVTVRGCGVGGRNQEFALAAALAVDEAARAWPVGPPPRVLTASFGTDGVDGPTDTAGAFVTERTAALARGLALDPMAALRENDSYTLFAALEARGVPALIRTGPTGTNVNDVMLGVVFPLT